MTANIKTLVSNTAQIVRIVSLQPGDVYKRLVESSYGSPKMQIGIVTGVMNNGDDAAITALEYEAAYGSVTAKVEVFTQSRDVSIFPADPAEVAAHLDEIQTAAYAKLDAANTAQLLARAAAEAVTDIVKRTARQSLTAAITEEGARAIK